MCEGWGQARLSSWEGLNSHDDAVHRMLGPPLHHSSRLDATVGLLGSTTFPLPSPHLPGVVGNLSPPSQDSQLSLTLEQSWCNAGTKTHSRLDPVGNAQVSETAFCPHATPILLDRIRKVTAVPCSSTRGALLGAVKEGFPGKRYLWLTSEGHAHRRGISDKGSEMTFSMGLECGR